VLNWSFCLLVGAFYPLGRSGHSARRGK